MEEKDRMKRHGVLAVMTALVIISMMLFSACAGNGGSVPVQADGGEKQYIYHDFTVQLCTCWNPHTVQTSLDSYPLDYIQSSFYSFAFNDELHPVDGKEPYSHYVIIPEMAADYPEDVTDRIRQERPEFGIPSDAKEGYAFSVRLRDDLCWDDGTPVNAYTFEESFKRLLDPKLVNYRASDFAIGKDAIVGAYEYAYGETADYSGVGLYAANEGELIFVFKSAHSGYSLYSGLQAGFLVKPDLYDSCLSEVKTASGSVWTSKYCTDVSTSVSIGPYKISSFQTDKYIRFVRNDKWFGYKDGNHVFVDPVDHKTCDMYQTTEIDCQVVAEAATQKRMFLAGELMMLALSSEDFDQYRYSEFAHSYPGSGSYFLALNGYEEVIKEREASPDFDRSTKDLETQLLKSFRKALSLSIDRELFVNTLFPGSSGGYGLFSYSYICNTDTLDRYRDTDVAREALCEFYSVDPAEYPSLLSAEESITGYDQKAATEYYQQAFAEAKEKGYITDNDNDGISDQTVTLVFTVEADTDSITRLVEYVNEILRKASVGTGFEGRIKVEKSAPLGNEWLNQFKNGLTDICMLSWNGAIMDPYSVISVYTYPEYAVNAAWYDSREDYMELELNGEKIRLSLFDWTNAVLGEEVTSEGKTYNFGEGMADDEVRIRILAGLEEKILDTYDYIPVMYSNSMALLSQQAYYPTDIYNPVMRFGGIGYLRYNYDEAEWKAHVEELGGTLKY